MKTFVVEIDAEVCKGCVLCIGECPKRVLAMSREFNSRGHHFAVSNGCKGCVGCLRCADVCPETAIEIAEELS